MAHRRTNLRMLGVGGLVFGIAPWLLLPALPGLKAESEAAGVVERFLRETRMLTIRTGHPHRLLLSAAGNVTTLEIRASGDSAPIETAVLPGIALERGPAWIGLEPTGGLRTPAAFARATLYPPGYWTGPSPPILWADIILAGSAYRRAGLVLDDASGRVNRCWLLAED